MKRHFILIFTVFTYCFANSQNDFTIAFGSCNKSSVENKFWDDIIALNPNVWIWGGDNIYADTDNMTEMRAKYDAQFKQKGYKELTEKVKILATWDDHDYGKNDAGEEYVKKKESQQLFLDFLNVSSTDSRRKRQGVYHAEEFKTKKGTVKIFVLDTRYHRTALKRDENSSQKKYIANTFNEGTILGKAQWKWLEQELNNSKADFNIIMSSIQVLSSQHRFEKWANFPHETKKLIQLIKTSKAKNTILLSGDRHISEFSKEEFKGIPYPIIDFTSSGLTHAYKGFTKETNDKRVGNVIFTESFGVLQFDFDSNKVIFQMRGNGNAVLQEISQIYP
ncbi:alkaline phosphatase D family protein [uncultured Tenacibaculum sp.]|uniref:alkaline phosphatase D family protein n=1 Tax=uncultured Tenacibaculum sp. TaxID=174713 RepID=UPI00261B3360|nr:alkaline phosphatase D family protein [uncultured Tenacibaculum sp.]